MPWSTPTLRQVRELVRGELTSSLAGLTSARTKSLLVGNSVLRVVGDTNAAVSHLCLRYIDWLSKQFLPDTAETEWLDRHGQIWLGGRKAATLAIGSVTFTGVNGTIIPKATRLTGIDDTDGTTVDYETTEQILIGVTATPCDVRALDPGSAGNRNVGDILTLLVPVSGVDTDTTVVVMEGGTEEETDEELRSRVLLRIRNPPMGGSLTDYAQWALSYPGVTRAWVSPLELGMGTVTVRFMMDDLRETDDGFPNSEDVVAVQTYLDGLRPVAVKDFFVEAPLPYPIDLTISGLSTDDESTRAAIEANLQDAFIERTEPGKSVYRSWIDEAISTAIGEEHHELEFETTDMPGDGYMAVLGTVTYA